MKQSVIMSNWISKLGDGNPDAMEIAFKRYFNKLISLASYRMKGIDQAVCSGEDLALSAINSFCVGVQNGRIQLSSEEELWGCLFCITVRKVSAEKRRKFSQKRGGNTAKFSGDAMMEEDGDTLFDSIAGTEPSPELAIQMAETTDELLGLFDKNSTQHKIISMKLQGVTVQKIAQELELLPRTIFWHLKTIRINWDFWKGMEYLIENSLEGASITRMTKFLEKSAEQIEQIMDKILVLWEKQSSAKECQILRLLWHDIEAFQSLLDQRDPIAVKVEAQLGKIAKQWLLLARTEWKNDLFRIWTEPTEKSS